MGNLIERNQQRKEKRVNILMCIFERLSSARAEECPHEFVEVSTQLLIPNLASLIDRASKSSNHRLTARATDSGEESKIVGSDFDRRKPLELEQMWFARLLTDPSLG
ncbi:hypothetical protein VNO77_46251 [Canavalia gladiata]|uniref:Uncharacterized protein n=1 Tax=Canavalia gladiata TaxID=3824 RepID=A0AAN9JKF2_CANGL